MPARICGWWVNPRWQRRNSGVFSATSSRAAERQRASARAAPCATSELGFQPFRNRAVQVVQLSREKVVGILDENEALRLGKGCDHAFHPLARRKLVAAAHYKELRFHAFIQIGKIG